jgi:hypothetical protein
MPSSSANANSSLQTHIEIGNETNTSNPHNVKQQRKSTASEQPKEN